MEDSNQSAQEQVITPWEVEGAVINGKAQAIDYDKLIEKFGTRHIDEELLKRFESLTGRKCHVFLRRGDAAQAAQACILGIWSRSFFAKVFDVPLVIQMTDDEKFLFKSDLSLEKARQFSYENAKDIIACGFKLEKTFIFSNLDCVGGAFYHNIVKISKCITASQSKATFGFNDSDCIGKLHFVAVQAAPSFSNSFPQIFGSRFDIPCLIPCAIDQDPYFRLTRDVAHKLKYQKPCLIHSKFFPALQGPQTKMSASVDNSAIFMSDTPNQIKKKINKFAFSGGGDTLELHKLHGGNPDVDVAYQYLAVFLDDDVELADIYKKYKAGEMMTGELKDRCIKILQKFVGDFQQRKSEITEETLKTFMDPNRKILVEGI
ncbi:8963_t:CDS:10 [Cetraspora pellucida]|uniref:8963_t:CDS:1 n=1 Tax=Cetraspora pellucida TaxID=1433469 RepID=A0ACA9LYF4_9GLOM|nr:8963_t:CDS:10 [Cetraspora pellucida]